MGKMHGFDLSHWNAIINYDKVEGDFVILKATQGVSFVDPTYKKNLEEFRKRKKLIGHYHFADGKDYKKEAKHFLDNIDLQKGDIIALDFEKYEIPSDNPVSWCYQWLLEIQKKTGIKPLIYLSAFLTHEYNWNNVIENGNGLWIADYKTAPARVGKWKFWAIRQTTSLGDSKGIIGSVDRDEFNGDEKQWRAYDYQKSPQSTKNEAVSDETVKDLQLSIKRYKDTLNEYIAKNKGLQEVIETQAKVIDDLETLMKKDVKEIRIGQAFLFLLSVIKNKLK